jgi:hypothetical protein
MLKPCGIVVVIIIILNIIDCTETCTPLDLSERLVGADPYQGKDSAHMSNNEGHDNTCTSEASGTDNRHLFHTHTHCMTWFMLFFFFINSHSIFYSNIDCCRL